jgi:2-polyprenyl-3-methyl-5-hydroxy-6-metoxy-1,4-benzoquinol methylase
VCDSDDVSLVNTIPARRLTDEWSQNLKIDILDEFGPHDDLRLYECRPTGLQFFLPLDVAGSARLYEQLEGYDWYYMSSKWEYDQAVRDLASCRRVLEIGCGDGAFVEQLQDASGARVEGIELNEKAVARAIAKGRAVRPQHVHQLAAEEPESFDAVCSFQVLEHVPDPRPFLENAVRLIRPNGKLVLCVPNSESFLRHQWNLLDMPPHHMTRWSRSAFESLQNLLPLRLTSIIFEPLARYHVPGFAATYTDYYRQRHALGRLFANGLTRSLAKRLLKLGLRRLFRGQSIYVVFERTAETIGSAGQSHKAA